MSLSYRNWLLPAVLLISILLTTVLVKAQETTVDFKITNAKKEPVTAATITIFSVPDTLHQQFTVTDSAGVASFKLMQGYPYIVELSSVEYKSFRKNITVRGDHPVFAFIAEPAVRKLNNVVVTATRPLMRQQDDKTIVDPEPLVSVSTNAYEIIEKTPGIYMDQDGNIYLNSTTPATIYINGREQKMSAADIATMLKNLPPNAISSIVILRTPSARYDASGSGGIVNVVLKKGIRIGLTGSVTLGANQGVYGNRFVGLNLNNSNGKMSTYLNLQIAKRNSFDRIRTDRFFAADSLLSQDAYTKYPGSNYYVGYGINYQLNRKWELAYDGRFSFNKNNSHSNNTSIITKSSTGTVNSNNEAFVDNDGNNFNLNQGLNLKYKIDSAGSEWTTDLSYTFTPNTTNQQFTTAYHIPVHSDLVGDGQLKNRLQFFSAQTNLVELLSGSLTTEAGIKTTGVFFNNNTNYYHQANGTRVADMIRSGSFRYMENINSAYVQASKRISGIVLKAGVRMENTNMSGHQLAPNDTSFDIHRTDFFPYIYLSKSIMKVMGYDIRAYLVYRRTITRPAYEYLNPAQRYIDPYLFETGNPSLRPQFTRNYEANISANEHPIFAVGINDTKDIFTQVVYPTDTNSRVSYRTYDNLGANREIYFRALGAIPPGKRYFFVVGLQYNHNLYEGQYENKPLAFNRASYTVFTYQTFKITPLTVFTLNGFARFNGQLQFYELSTFGSLNLSLAQQFLKKKLVVTLSMNDLLYTNNNHFVLQQGTVDASGFRESDTRRFGINLRYSFGIRKKEENNMLNMESPEKN